MILKQRAALERPMLQIILSQFRGPERLFGCGCRLPLYTRDIMGISGNVFERLPAQRGPPRCHFGNSENWASSSREVKPTLIERPRGLYVILVELILTAAESLNLETPWFF